MSAQPPKAAVAMAEAIELTMASPAWAGALGDDDARAWMLLEALCERLHPIAPVDVPSVGSLRAAADRPGRDQAIRRDFDGRNYAVLARRHRLSTRQVRRIVDDGRRQRR